MYLHKKSEKRKFTPVNRRYARKAKIKKIAVFLTVLAFAEGAFLFWHEGKNFWENIKLPPAFTWQIKEIDITAPTENIRIEIEKLLKAENIQQNRPFSSKEVQILEEFLNKNVSQVKNITVKRLFLKKKLFIEAQKYIPFAYIIMKEHNFFITEDGQIFQDDEIKNKEGFLNVYLNAKIESDILAKELVQFIKEVKKTPLRKTNTVLIDTAVQTAAFDTAFGPVKLKRFKEVQKQLSVLTEILKVAKEKKFKLPYLVDFTYFDKGKVYLKQEYKDL